MARPPHKRKQAGPWGPAFVENKRFRRLILFADHDRNAAEFQRLLRGLCDQHGL